MVRENEQEYLIDIKFDLLKILANTKKKYQETKINEKAGKVEKNY